MLQGLIILLQKEKSCDCFEEDFIIATAIIIILTKVPSISKKLGSMAKATKLIIAIIMSENSE